MELQYVTISTDGYCDYCEDPEAVAIVATNDVVALHNDLNKLLPTIPLGQAWADSYKIWRREEILKLLKGLGYQIIRPAFDWNITRKRIEGNLLPWDRPIDNGVGWETDAQQNWLVAELRRRLGQSLSYILKSEYDSQMGYRVRNGILTDVKGHSIKIDDEWRLRNTIREMSFATIENEVKE